MKKSLSRNRAAYAYSRLHNIPKETIEKIQQRLKGLPIQVRTQGLSIAFAVLASDDSRVPRDLIELIIGWLLHEESPVKSILPIKSADQNRKPEFFRWCMESDSASYRAVQREAISFLETAKVISAAIAKP
jgi:hypothetical protein